MAKSIMLHTMCRQSHGQEQTGERLQLGRQTRQLSLEDVCAREDHGCIAYGVWP
jgi:hypothetical protein